MTITLNVKVDLRGLLSIQRYSKSNRAVLSEVAADRYVKYLRTRFLGMSNAGWTRLKESTIKRKTRRQKLYNTPANVESVLRETNTLYNRIEKKTTSQGQVVGYVRDSVHPSTPDRRKKKNKGIRISRLVRIHQNGGSYLPSRKIIVPPNEDTRKRMAEDIRRKYAEIISRYSPRKK